jgi:perosamine synthetase
MIKVSEPLFNATDQKYVAECVRSGWVSSAGKFIDEFEDRWARYCGRRYGIAVSNGTVALQVALACLRLQPGDEVIMPTFTIVSCALAAIYNGAVPVLVDADPRTWCMDVSQIEARITPRTRAVMPVHIYGHPVDMDPILQLASRYGLAIVEDAAEAHGAEYLAGRTTHGAGWRRCGSFGELSCFSFYANKLVTTGEGGMILTDDATLAERARSLRNLCFEPGRRFLHQELGFNFRFTNLQAALGLGQVERIEQIVARKRSIGQAYCQRLASVAGLQLPAEEPWARNVYWMVGMVLADETRLDAMGLARALSERGVETRPFFLGMHEQPALLRKGLFRAEAFPIAERLARQGLYVPSGLGLTDAQLETVCDAIRETLA